MSENESQASDTTNEKEVVIELNENKETEKEEVIESKPKIANKFVERKQIGDLNDEERALIVSNAKNGINQPFYDVKLFKNGKYRILKKKEQQQTISQKIVNSNSIPKEDKKVYYSDNQILFEHIIELNAKIDKLTNKHKKLKRRYQTLQNDIYVDDEDISQQQIIKNDDDENEEVNNKEIKNNEVENNELQHQQIQQQQQPIMNKRMNWRSRLTYL